MQKAMLKMFVAAVLALLLCTSAGATPASRSLLGRGNGHGSGNGHGRGNGNGHG